MFKMTAWVRARVQIVLSLNPRLEGGPLSALLVPLQLLVQLLSFTQIQALPNASK